ncbi:MAG TPA: 50S ribosomal protein L10 [Elusimicrobia bacterium]|jgi:large subunit ribosomal protein L10|nr:50S ribosomal protein L10 [Elusimicrobiota bacterium]
MKRKEKEKFISQIVNELKEQKIFFFTSFQGVKTEEINELRNHLRVLSWEYRVVKNTLYQRVFKNLELGNLNSDSINKLFQGPTGLLLEKYEKGKKSFPLGNSNPVELSKILLSFVKNHPNFKINAGFITGRVLSKDGIANLAKLPSQEILLKQLASCLQLPLFRFVNALKAPLRDFIYLLDCRSKKNS